MPSNDPGYQKKYHKIWYQKNKLTRLASCRLRKDCMRAEARIKLIDYLNSHPCVDCGEMDILVLQFDHIKGSKTTEVTKMVNSGYTWDTILKEIEKCEIRCANDHIRRTARIQNNFKVRQLISTGL